MFKEENEQLEREERHRIWLREEEERRRIKARKESREELFDIIKAWAKAKQIEEFFPMPNEVLLIWTMMKNSLF